MSEEPESPTQAFHRTPSSPIDPDQAEALFGLLSDPSPEAEPSVALDDLRSLFPQYEVFGQIGRGGMGVVYKARHKGLDRVAAIKLLPPELGGNADFVARFQREARAMARLEHPNIIGVYDFGQTPSGQPYFVMEFVDGSNLADLIRSGAFRRDDGDSAPALKLDPLVVAAQLCEALAYAHGEGIVHRDIKPANVLIDRRGRVKVADFGLARFVAAEIEVSALTATGTVMGTLDYMAPEQRRGMQVDQRADIYSLGVMVYEMFCGEVPHGVFEPPSSKAKCDPRIDAIVSTAMQNSPERRYQSTAEMKAAVDGVRAPSLLAAPAPASAAAGQSALQIPPAVRGRRSVAMAVSVLVLLLAGAGAWWVTRKPQLAMPDHFSASVAPADSSAKANPPRSGVAGAPAPIKLWSSADKLPPPARWEDNAARLDGSSLIHSSSPARDAILRASIRMNPDAESPQIALRCLGDRGIDPRYLLGVNLPMHLIILQAVTNGKFTALKSWPFPRDYRADEWMRLEFTAIGNELTASVDGRPLGTVRDSSQPSAGGVQLYAAAKGYFRDIEYVPFDPVAAGPKPSAATPAPIKLWDTPGKLPKDPRLTFTDGVIHIENAPLSTDRTQGRDVILRAKVRMNPDAAYPQLMVRVIAGDVCLAMPVVKKGTIVLQRPSPANSNLGEWPLPRTYGPDDWAAVELRAVGDEVSVAVDGHPLGSAKVPPPIQPGRVAVFAQANGYFRDIEYVSLDAPASGEKPNVNSSAVIKLWDAPAKLPNRSGVRWEDNAVRLEAESLQLYEPVSRDGILRASVRGAADLSIRVRRGAQADSGYLLGVDEQHAHLNSMQNGQYPLLKVWNFPSAAQPGQWRRFELRIAGDKLTVLVDGQTLGTVADATLTEAGGVMIHSSQVAYFRDIEYVPLDAGSATRTASGESGTRGAASLPTPSPIKLWDAPGKLSGRFARWEENTVRIDEGSLILEQPVSRDAILRASVKFVEGSAGLSLRHQPSGTGRANYYMASSSPDGGWHVDYGHDGETTKIAEGRNGRKCPPGEWARCELRIVGGEIAFSQEGELLGTWHDTSLTTPGAVMLYATKTAFFRDIEYVPLDRVAASAANAKATSAANTASEPWQDYLARLRSLGALTGNHFLSDDGTHVRLVVGSGYDIVLGNDEPALDSALRVVATWSGGKNLRLHLRCQRDSARQPICDYQLAFDRSPTIKLLRHDYSAKEDTLVGEWNYPPGFDYDAEHTCEFRAVGDQLSGRLDGRDLGTVQDKFIDRPGQSSVTLAAGGTLREIKTLRLDR